ncbi:MAG: extracellular solute-binding protein [Microbacteriaceae bacterium]
MRITRLIAAGVITAAFGGMLVGCSSGTDTASGDCHLEILGRERSTTDEESAWSEVFSDFEDEYGCSVSATWSGDFTEVASNLNAAKLAGEQVDLVTTATSNYSMAQAGLLMDLTDIVDQFGDRFTDKALADFTLGDHLWSMPYGDQSYSVFFYNKTMFDDLGLEAPTSYAEFAEVAGVLADNGITPVVEGGSDTWSWPMWLMATIGEESGNDSIATLRSVLSGDASFTDQEWVDAYADIQKFAEDGLIDSDVLDTDGSGALAAIAQGKAAMTYNGSWTLASARELDTDFEWGVFLFPVIDPSSGATGTSSGTTEDGIAMSASIDPDNIPMASQFLEYISRPEVATKIMTPQSMISPSVIGVDPVDDALADQIVNEIQPATVQWLDWIWPNEVNDATISAVQGVLFGDESPEDAAASMQDALDTLVAQNDYQYDWWDQWDDADWSAVTPAEIPTVEVG